MLRFDVITLMPEVFPDALAGGVLGRAIAEGHVAVEIHNLRDYTLDRHRTADDTPFGGGDGMVMKPEPIFAALGALGLPQASGRASRHRPPEEAAGDLGRETVIMLTPQGVRLDQDLARRLAGCDRLALICGRYGGVDERVVESAVDLELSIGDYVLSGGEFAALVVIDALTRLLPGVLGCAESALADSFTDWLLESPQYTRPREYEGRVVPEILLSGDHGAIERWRRRQGLKRTLERRPDLLAKACLNAEDRAYLEELAAPGKANETEADEER